MGRVPQVHDGYRESAWPGIYTRPAIWRGTQRTPDASLARGGFRPLTWERDKVRDFMPAHMPGPDPDGTRLRPPAVARLRDNIYRRFGHQVADAGPRCAHKISHLWVGFTDYAVALADTAANWQQL